MYDAPFTTPVALGWILAAVTGVLVAARAVRVELRAGRPRGGATRVVDAGLGLLTGASVLALLVVLGVVLASA